MSLDNHLESTDFLEVECTEGDLVYLKGHPHPFKGHPTEERVLITNIFKQIFRLNPKGYIDAFNYVIQYDWAFRLRFLDLCNETTTELLTQNPRKEIKRLMALNKERDIPKVHRKLNKFATIIQLILLYPPLKRKFKEMAQNLPKPDESDKYWMRLRTDYKSGV